MAIGIFLFSTRNVLHQLPQVYSIPQDVINIQQISLTPGIRTIVRKERLDPWRTEAEDTEILVLLQRVIVAINNNRIAN